MTGMHRIEAPSGSNSFVALATLDQAALDALPEAVYLCAADGTVVRFNQKAAELWGRTPKSGDPEERFCGTYRLYRTNGALLPHDQCPMAVALQTGECFHNQEVVVEQPSGRRLTVLASIAAFRDQDGRVSGAINWLKDVTDLKRAEAKLRESERRFREMIDALPAAIYTTDAEGHITHFNPAAAAFAGRAPVLGTDEWCVTWKLYHPDGTPMPHDQCPMAIALKEGRAVRGAEAIAERPDGTQVWFTPYPTPLRDDSGRIVGAINMLVDITERKRVEARIQADADVLIRLNELSSRLWSMRNLRDGLDEMLAATIEMLGADFGKIQLLDETRGVLTIEAQRGFSQDFLDFFHEVSAQDGSACGRALRTGERVIVEDVDADAALAPMRHVCRAAGFRAVQSTPLLGRDGRPTGMISTHFRAVHRPTEHELHRLDLYARQAADFIERCRADEALHRAQAERESELADTKLLASVSAELVREENVQGVYEKIIDAAMSIMRSDYASMQMLYPDRGELRLLAFRGFNPQAAKFWEWVRTDSSCTCGIALANGLRCIEPDVANSSIMPGTADQATYLETGIRAVQSTPLISRGGKLVGMISTHWKQPHQPIERDLRLLDLLARQAADLIDRKRAEETLRESEERFRNMADNISQLAWMCDQLGHVTWYNKRWLDYTGLTFEDIKDWGWKQVQHPDHVDRVVAGIMRSRETSEPWEDTFPLRGADGSYRWFLSRAVPIRDDLGNVVRWFGTNTGITEQREAQEAAARLAAIVQTSNDAIVSKDLDGIITSWNEAARRIFGYTTQEAVGRPITMLIPPDRQHEEDEILSRLKRGERIDHFETKRQRKDGSLLDVSLTISPIKDRHGRVVGASKIARDITDRKKGEETQQLLVRELNHRVKNTLASVQAIVQHTFRSTRDPATFVDAFAGRIQSLARVHSLLTETTWEGADLRELIHDQLLQGAVDDTRITAWGPPVRLEAQMTLHLALVLHELGTNAHKHGALSATAGWVTIGWTVEGHWLRLRWEERGGPQVISPATRGFGTTLIEQSVKSEGGNARMSVGHDGLLWEIGLPLPAKAATDATASRARDMVNGASPPHHAGPAAKPLGNLVGQRFLVVEDEPLIALDIAAGLEQAGVEVVASTGSAREALDLIESKALDAALLDGSLHGLPVDEIAAALARRKVPFLFVTGYGRESLPQAFRNAAVLSKPFSPQQLVEAAARLVEPRADMVHLRDFGADGCTR